MTTGEKLRSIVRPMRPQVYLISERGQKIFYWKLGQGYRFIFIVYFHIFFIGPLRDILQRVPVTTDIAHASMISLIFLFFWRFAVFVDTFDDIISTYFGQ